ncbi:MAG: type 4a pilus biogenesis protein PilO [Candidatus Omnitrophota bacterium]
MKLDFITSMLANLSKKEKTYLCAAGIVLFIALFDRLVVGPVSKESNDLEEKIVYQIGLIKKNLSILRYKEKILEERALYLPYFTKEGLTEEELIAVFLRDVEQLAKTAGITLTNVNPVTVDDRREYVLYDLTVECTGPMKNMLDFIYGVDAVKKPIRVTSFEVYPKKRAEYEVNSTITVTKMIIYENPSKQSSSGNDK